MILITVFLCVGFVVMTLGAFSFKDTFGVPFFAGLTIMLTGMMALVLMGEVEDLSRQISDLKNTPREDEEEKTKIIVS